MSNNDCVKEFKNECTLRAAVRGSVTELGNMYLILTAPSVSLVSTSVCNLHHRLNTRAGLL